MMSPLCQKEQTVCFENDDVSPTYDLVSTIDETRKNVVFSDCSLQEFLSRPVKIGSFQWTPASTTPVIFSLNPWSAFMTNPAVAKKLNNFYLASMDLKVKIVINGGPFYYGNLLASYHPLKAKTTFPDFASTDAGALVPLSQRPHLYLDPCTSKGGTIKLPFWWYADMIRLPRSEFNQLGTIDIREVVSLQHVNGGTAPVTVSLYAWAENCQLTTPTMSNQSGEIGETPIGDALLSSANVVSKLNNVVMFEPYSRPTAMVLGYLGRLARLAGFSRPQILSDIQPVANRNCAHIANFDRPEPVQKLSLSSKQELTVDPRTLGMGWEDELDILSLAKRESYYFKFPWLVSDGTDKLLASCCVSPVTFATGPAGTPSFYMTPMCWVARLFRFWRGTINYRFQIVASAQHKGKLKFQYDPYGGSANPSNYNSQYTRIIDISKTKDFTIPIHWTQNTSFKAMQQTWAQLWSLTAYQPHDGFANGVWSITVQESLTTPSAVVSNIAIIVSVSAGDDFELAEPTAENIASLAPFSNQSGDLADRNDPSATGKFTDSEPFSNNILSEIGEETKPDHTYDVYFGEKVTSLRQLLRRYQEYNTLWPPLATRTALSSIVTWRIIWSMPTFPQPYGYHSLGQYTTTGPLAKKYDNVFNTHISYISLPFATWRGSVRWKLCAGGNQTNTDSIFTVVKRSGYEDSTNKTINIKTASAIYSGTTSNSDAILTSIGATGPSGLSGSAIGGVYDSSNVEIDVPYVNLNRFSCPRSLTVDSDQITTWLDIVANSLGNINFRTFVATGEDFSFNGFINVPLYYRYDIVSTI